MESHSLRPSLAETLAVFDGAAEPLTTPEVAERVGLERRTAYARLERLVEEDRIDTKKVGAGGRVWWRPPTGANRQPETGDGDGPGAAGAGDAEREGAEREGAETEAVGPEAVGPEATGAGSDASRTGERRQGHQSADEQRLERQVSRMERRISQLDGQTDDLASELARYATTVEAVRDGVATVDADGRFVTVNEAFCELTGHDRAALLGEPATRVLDEALQQEFSRTPDDAAVDEPDVATLTSDLRIADGEAVPVEAHVRPCEFGDGSVGGTVVVRDVSERQARRRELRRYEALIRESRDVNTVMGPDGTYRYVPPSMAPVLGHDPDELVGRNAFDLVHPDDRDRVEASFGNMVERIPGEPSVEYRFRRADGTWAVLESRGRNLLDDPDVEGIVAYSRDVTDRTERERAIDRHREQLAALQRLNEVVGEITTAIVSRSTRAEIERAVCERLAASDSYLYAWIGGLDLGSEELTVRAEAGVEGYLDDVTLSVDPEVDRYGPVARRALRTGETQVVQDIASDDRYDPWREHIEAHGFRSKAVIPIVQDDFAYGVLHVYADRPDAFAAAERDVIGRLGEVVGHAIAATERKLALQSDEVVEVEFRVQDFFAEVGAAVETDGTISLQGVVPLEDDDFLVYGTATPDATGAVTALCETVPFWEEVDFLSGGDGSSGDSRTDEPSTFELRLSEAPILSVVAALGGYIDSAVVEDGDYRMVVHLAPGTDVRRVVGAVQETYPSVELVTRRQRTRGSGETERLGGLLVDDLTDRQRAVLQTAYHAGYFEWPRGATGEDAAAALGITSPTFHQHLRTAERKVFDSLLSSAIGGYG